MSGNTNTGSIDFFDNVFTFLDESVTVNCCHTNNTIQLATCGLGISCAGSCSALGASLCPSGNCTGDCDIPLELEADQINTRKDISLATRPSNAFRWCSPKCHVRRHKGCCYNPLCSRKRKKGCERMKYLTGTSSESFIISQTYQCFFQERHVLIPAVCPLAHGHVSFRMFPCVAPLFWIMMHRCTLVSMD